jgi:hypothetical protein
MLKKDLRESAEISRQPTFGTIVEQAKDMPKPNSKANSEILKQNH